MVYREAIGYTNVHGKGCRKRFSWILQGSVSEESMGNILQTQDLCTWVILHTYTQTSVILNYMFLNLHDFNSYVTYRYKVTKIKNSSEVYIDYDKKNWTSEMCWSLMRVITATKLKLCLNKKCRQLYIFFVLHDSNNIMKINIPAQNF